MHAPRAAVAWLACLLLLLVGCTTAGGTSQAERADEPTYDSYVALGDSYTAGPLIPTTDISTGCFRSDHNYPSLVAAALETDKLTDVSCSGATTKDLAGRQVLFSGTKVRPQFSALREDTDLVTLGIGGNDFGLFGTLLNRCSSVAGTDPTGAPCAAELDESLPDLAGSIRRIGDRVAAAVETIEKRSPDARVVLVGYLRLAPSTGTCAALPFADGDYALANQVSSRLRDTVRRAARTTGADFVDAFAASAGHDACSDQPWVNGGRTIRGKAFAYHPLRTGMKAVADRLVETLQD